MAIYINRRAIYKDEKRQQQREEMRQWREEMRRLSKSRPAKKKRPPGQPKNAAAVALGRLGGLASGPARMRRIPSAIRSEIARHAVLVRWEKYRERLDVLKRSRQRRASSLPDPTGE